MKILIGSLTYPLPNGVTNSINESIDGFLEAGHDVLLIAPDYGTGSVRPEHFLVRGSKVSHNVIKFFGVQGKKELVFGWGARREIMRIADQFQPDAYWLHQVTYAANAFERLVFKSAQPSVLTYHTSIDVYGKMYAGEIGEQAMIRRSVHVANKVSHVIAPSHYIKNKLMKWGVNKPIEVVSTGIQPAEESYSAEELHQKFSIVPTNKILLFVGRVVKEKNISALLTMVKEIVKTRQDITLLLIGPGDIEETIKEAQDLGIQKYVVLSGQLPQEETVKCYGGADLFVFASQSETQGLVVGEAMSAGLPVVALTSPIQPEVYPSEVAVVVKDPIHFGQAVINTLDNKKEIERLKTVGKDFVEKHFSKKTMIEKQIGVFESVIHARNERVAISGELTAQPIVVSEK